jgi:hypothetical protein
VARGRAGAGAAGHYPYPTLTLALTLTLISPQQVRQACVHCTERGELMEAVRRRREVQAGVMRRQVLEHHSEYTVTALLIRVPLTTHYSLGAYTVAGTTHYSLLTTHHSPLTTHHSLRTA